jgi:hypothetical protein
MVQQQQQNWSKAVYEASLSSCCWRGTSYVDGWDACPALVADKELERIVELEHTLGTIPGWAQMIADRCINYPPFCPHHFFPQPYWEVLDAIGAETTPGFIHGCYTADYERKERMQSYVFCLDAWLAGVEPERPARELAMRGNDSVDWDTVCHDLWRVLGERTELKELLVERALHRLRWWMKSLVWDDDARDLYCRDQYLGDIDCEGEHYGNPEFCDPYFTELDIPRVVRMEARLAQMCPDWEWFRDAIHNSWLCAPEAFRFLERLLWAIGQGRKGADFIEHPMKDGDDVPGFLQCDDTYASIEDAAAWVRSFVDGLHHWTVKPNPARDMDREISRRLGARTPLKVWLARLYLRKLQLLNPFDALGETPAAHA